MKSKEYEVVIVGDKCQRHYTVYELDICCTRCEYKWTEKTINDLPEYMNCPACELPIRLALGEIEDALFICHVCSHEYVDWFLEIEECPKCGFDTEFNYCKY